MRTFFIALALLTAAMSAHGQQSGVLLGLQVAQCSDAETHCNTILQTLWIAPEGGEIKLVAKLADSIVPRADGFWRVGLRTYCETPDDESITVKDVLFAVPVRERPTLDEELVSCDDAQRMARENYLRQESNKSNGNTWQKALPSAADPCESISIAVDFLNPSYASTITDHEFACAGRPSMGRSFDVWRLESLGKTPVSLSTLFGAKAGDNYMRLARRALLANGNKYAAHMSPPGEPPAKYRADRTLEELSRQEESCFPADVNDGSWYIARQEGHWLEQGGIRTFQLCGVEVDFALPRSMFDWSMIDKSLPVDMHWVREQVPDAKDAYCSPRKDLLVVFMKRDLMLVYKPKGEQIGAPVLSLPLPKWTSPFMAEWAVGAGVERWTHELKTLQNEQLPEPILPQVTTTK